MDISYGFSSNPTKFIPPQIELNQFVRTAQKATYVGNIKF